jgi:hypothetical protein
MPARRTSVAAARQRTSGAYLADARASTGAALHPAARDRLESSFGVDLSSVRIHAGVPSSLAAGALGARAFTDGRHIHFADRAYDPNSRHGFELLAHEAAHAIQSGLREPSGPAASARISAPDDTVEADAGRSAKMAVDRRHVPQAFPVQQSSQFPICLAPNPVQTDADRVIAELQTVISGATWKEIRKRVYPKESAAGIQRAGERHQGNRPDLTGLGKLAVLQDFADGVRAVQSQWSTLTPNRRVAEIGKVANRELTAADVPGFLALNSQPMQSKGFFTPSQWSFTISEELVKNNALTNDDAGQVANVGLHESRHAEQAFLAARFSAGTGADAATIARDEGIPGTVATKAVAMKFDARTDPKVSSLGQAMFQSMVTNRDANQATTGDSLAAIDKLDSRRELAKIALTTLQQSATPENVSDARQACEDLKAQITVVEQKYSLYRAIPHEADAHEVGDAEEQAFKGWPGAGTQRTQSPLR